MWRDEKSEWEYRGLVKLMREWWW